MRSDLSTLITVPAAVAAPLSSDEVTVAELKAIKAPDWRGESRRQRRCAGLVALLCVLGYGFFLKSMWAPAPSRPGIDENAYLLGGANLAEHGSAGFKPANDYQFVGAMWFRNSGDVASPPAWIPNPLRQWLSASPKPGWYFPKYPLGVPTLNAVAIRLGGPARGRICALAIPPIAMTLAAAGMYLLAVEVVPAFYAILAMIALMFGPTSLQLAELPNSHAIDLCAVVWGMWLLLRWWRSGQWYTGLAAGLLLGVAVTIRYSEALLLFPLYPLDQVLSDTSIKTTHRVLWTAIEMARLLPIGPLGVAVLWRIRWRQRTSYLRALLPIVGWGLPVSLMLIVSWFTTGHLTGYDATHESAGFSTADFLSKWDFSIFQLLVYGLFLLLPIGLAGLVMVFKADRRLGWFLTLWFLPGALLYTAYYWGEDVPGVGYLRFFLSLLPPLIIAGMWVMWRAGDDVIPRARASVAGPLGAALLVTASAAVGLYISLPEMQRQHRGDLNLAYSTREILHYVRGSVDPAKRPVVFADDGLFPQLLQHLQFMASADWFATDAFEPRVGGGFGIFGMFQQADAKKNTPVLLQRERMEYMDRISKGKTVADFVREERDVIHTALHAHRPVFAVLTPPQATYFRQRVKDQSITLTERTRWTEPCADHPVNSEDNSPTGPGNAHGRNPLALPNWSGEPLIRWHPQTLVLYELTNPEH